MKENAGGSERFAKKHLNDPFVLDGMQSVSARDAISKVFREIGLADELGSGMRNTYKFTKLYSGGIPNLYDKNLY